VLAVVSVSINEIQQKVLNEKFLGFNLCYGETIKHIEFKSWVVDFNEKDNLIIAREELCELGILRKFVVDRTLMYYEITGIGDMFYHLVNNR
jgi:hypothetical protein